MARLLSTQSSFLPQWGALLLEGGLQHGAMLWLWEPLLSHIFGGLGGRRALLQVLLAPLAVYVAYRVLNTVPAALLLLSPAPPAEWQVHPPQGLAGARPASSLSG